MWSFQLDVSCLVRGSGQSEWEGLMVVVGGASESQYLQVRLKKFLKTSR